MTTISAAERCFIRDGITCNVRSDGRTCYDYRNMTIECGIFPQANGSARLSVTQAGTDIIVAIKAEIGSPATERPEHGRVECSVDCWASATTAFATGRKREQEDMSARLSQILQSTLSAPGAIDTAALCLAPGRACWVIYVDVIVLSSGGSLIDSITLATFAALNNTLLPKVTVSHDPSTESTEAQVEDAAEAAAVSGRAISSSKPTNETKEEFNFQVDHDPSTGWQLPAHNAPIAITLYQFADTPVVDASIEEESCADAAIVIAINRNSEIVSVTTYSGAEQVSVISSWNLTNASELIGTIEPNALIASLEAAEIIANVLFKRVDASLEQEKEAIRKSLNSYTEEIRTGQISVPTLQGEDTLMTLKGKENSDEIRNAASILESATRKAGLLSNQ